MGQHAADWLEGKSIPQAMDILPKALKLDNIASYEVDLADPRRFTTTLPVAINISECTEISV